MTSAARLVRLRDAERELRLAWRALDEETRRDGGEGMLRLREVNLVVVCPEETLAEARETAGLVTKAHPARVIFIVSGPRPPARGGDPGGSTAEIASACLVDESSGHQLCSEEVILRGAADEDEALRAVVLQLLVPDVPVVGWWVDDPAGARDFVLQQPAGALLWLAEISDQVVTDLRRSRRPSAALGSLRDLVERPDGVGLRELEWLRSARWRVLTAELFERPENRSLIPLLTHLEVEHDDAPLQALLFAAWFASRLGLVPRESGWWVEGGFSCARFVRPGEERAISSELIVRLRPGAVGEPDHTASLTAIRMHAETGAETTDTQVLSLRRRPHSCVCCAAAGPAEDELVIKSLRVADGEDHQELSRVIDTPLRDAVLRDALLLAAALVEQPGFDLGGWPVGGEGGPDLGSSA